MKLLDKFKNMFTEPTNDIDEEDDIIVEQIQKDVTHVPIESPNNKNNKYEEDKIIEKFKFEETEKKEQKPIFFDEEDFNNLNFKSEHKREEKHPDLFTDEIKKDERNKKEVNAKPKESISKETKTYNESESKEEKKIFKPTPIISPVYGILDKNYHKEDIVSRVEPKKEKENVEPTIDTIRNKAYGTLEDELENTLFGSNSILFKNNFKDTEDEEKIKENIEIDELNEDVLSDLTDDIGKELDELLVKKEKYSDEDLEEKVKENIKKDGNLNEEDLLGFIDSTLYKRGDEE